MNQLAKEGIEQFLRALSVDTKAPELEKTPTRVTELYEELFSGVGKETKELWGELFSTDYNGLVAVTDIPFYSMCEHHMMPFFGKYWFAYIPNPKGKILGISKVGRVVDYCAARLQVQERLAKDIIVMLQEALGSEYPPLAMGIVLEGEHLCKSMRGVKKEGKMRSSFYFDNGSLPELRAELSRFVSFG